MNPPDEVFLKRAAECERMANSLATLREVYLETNGCEMAEVCESGCGY
jgi:hypothetical protein